MRVGIAPQTPRPIAHGRPGSAASATSDGVTGSMAHRSMLCQSNRQRHERHDGTGGHDGGDAAELEAEV